MANTKTLGDAAFAAGAPPDKGAVRQFVDSIGWSRDVTVTAAFVAVAFDRVQVDTTDGPFIGTMPAPADLEPGDEFRFNDIRAAWGTSRFTLDGNGTSFSVNGVLSDRLVCDVPGRFTVVFDDAVFQLRSVQVDYEKLNWTIARSLGARVAEYFDDADHGTANMTDDGGGLISAWKGRVTGLTLAASGSQRPTRDENGLLFNGAQMMASSGLGPINGGSNGGSIFLLVQQLALDNAPRNLISIGSSTQQRTLRVNASTHRPGALTTAGTVESTVRAFVGESVIQGKFIDGRIDLWLNAEFLGSVNATITAGSTGIRLGASLAGTPDRFAKCYVRKILFVNGDTSREEDIRIAAELAGSNGFEILCAAERYRARNDLTLAENLVELDDTMTAAALVTTPDDDTDMSPAPTITASTAAPSGLTAAARYTTTAALFDFFGGFERPRANYRAAPAGLLGYIDVEGVPTLFPTNSSYTMAFETTAPKVAVRVFGSASFPYRMMIDGKFADRAGTFTHADTGTQYILYDVGSSAWRLWTLDINRSNLVAGILVGPNDLVRRQRRATKFKNWIFLGDSMTHGLIEGYHWDGQAPRAARKMGMRRWMANGVDGSDAVYRPFETGFNMLDRFADVADVGSPAVSDYDVALRQTLDMLGKADPDGLSLHFGVNAIASGFGATGMTEAYQTFLTEFRKVKEHVPVVVFGPVDRLAPSPVESGFDAVEAAIEAGCDGQPNVVFKSLRGVAYAKRAGDPTHGSYAGAGTLATRIAADCHDAVAALRALYA
ncbi:hypothetical protein [Reyranella sp.]|uniref:hypothetical protein n=1 Tax=Reyranella sp. TaxID=1929291 RepID=UPI003F6F76EA